MAAHKMGVKYGKKVIEKYLTERQIRMLQKRRKVWFQVDHVLVFLMPKPKNMRALRQIQIYKEKIKLLEAKVK